MGDKLYIQQDALQTRVVLTRDGVPVELRVESHRGRGLSGNIYRGRVARVVPELQAAFVDIGTDRMGMLNAADVWLAALARKREPGGVEVPGAPKVRLPRRDITAMLEPGQEIMVQVSREPAAKKGPRVTMFVTLPGRNMVFLAREPHIGVSQRIDQPGERDRLRDLAGRLLPLECGAIIRTVGEGATEAEIGNDAGWLKALWRDVETRFAHASAPSFLFNDQDLALRAVRDLVSPATEEVWVDDGQESARISNFLLAVHPESRPVVRVHDGPGELLAAHDLDAVVRGATEPRVLLPGGGDIVIERTEAMTVVDVNSGPRGKGEGLDDAALRLNLAAASEIARQLRLRNIGGLVVIDFVDMKKADDCRMLEAVLASEFSGDGARVRMSRLNRFGLVVLTRKRERESVYQRLTETCPTCDGRGYVRAASDLAIEALSRLRVALRAPAVAGSLVRLTVAARVAAVLEDQLADVIADMQTAANVRVEIVSAPADAAAPSHVHVASGRPQ